VLITMAVATLAAGLFSGAALYISLVEHPARLQCGPAIALAEFKPSYRRAAVMQASLAATGMVACVATWVMGGRDGWLMWGLVLGSVIPFTLVAIWPTNRRLLNARLTASAPDVGPLLARWGLLHAVRTVVSLTAFLALITLLIRC
jgi:hypothetical protein